MKKRGSFGFTLIEMMVAISVMGLLVGSGIASYRKFNDRQRVLSAGKEFVQLLRVAQKKANAGEKPTSGCGTLSGYRVTANNSSVAVYALCNNGAQVILDSAAGKTFDSDIVFAQSATYEFAVLAKGVSGPLTLEMGTTTTRYQIEVSPSGSIDGGET